MVRVFVSSVIEGFAGLSAAAARNGIKAAGAEPVMVNEDLPSKGTSSRNACLDAIDSSDYVLSIVGKRGGWTTPSGRLVVEEEFEHALVRSLPVLAFVQETTRDADAESLLSAGSLVTSMGCSEPSSRRLPICSNRSSAPCGEGWRR